MRTIMIANPKGGVENQYSLSIWPVGLHDVMRRSISVIWIDSSQVASGWHHDLYRTH